MIFRENKDYACTHRCTPRATSCELKMLSLACAYLAALWTLAWVTLGWGADGILTWSPVQGWKRHRIEGSENPQNSECPLLQPQEVISFSPLGVSHSRMRSVKKCSLVWCYRRMLGASASSPQAGLASPLTLDWATEVQKLKCRGGWQQVQTNLANFLPYVSVFVLFLFFWLDWSCLFCFVAMGWKVVYVQRTGPDNILQRLLM